MRKTALALAASILCWGATAADAEQCAGCAAAEKARSVIAAGLSSKGGPPKGAAYVYRDKHVVVMVVDLPSATASQKQALNDRSILLQLYTSLREHQITTACASKMKLFLAAGVTFRVVWRSRADKMERFTTEVTRSDCK